ncbi:MAG: sulfatase-like hydrolase/transferase [Candidatus Promineofilum sp.]|nr:sulfatase-like hydrolase/transferase [Promineifilum sp.]
MPNGCCKASASPARPSWPPSTAYDWLAEQTAAAANPFAYYVHLLPPHGPYKTRHEFIDIFDDGWTPPTKELSLWSEGVPQERLNYQRRTYDEFIAYVDAEFARLFDMLESNGTLDNTYLILTSDHGELFERGIAGHSTNSLNDPILNIPLFIWKPGQTQRVDVFERTSAVDIVPTLLHLAGQPARPCRGASCPPWAATPPPPTAPSSPSRPRPTQVCPVEPGHLAFYQGPYKLISYRGYEQLPSAEALYQLFNLDNDPEEMEDLYTIERGVADTMTAQLQQRLEEANQPFQRS